MKLFSTMDLLFDEFGVDDGEAIRSGADYEAVASDGVAIN